MFTLLKNARVLSPHDLGVKDILFAAGKIAMIGRDLKEPHGLKCRTLDAQGLTAIPGLIDLHAHITGGGGEGGPETKIPEVSFNDIVSAGVTTVVGLLGTDDVCRTPVMVLARAQALNRLGMSAYIFTGSYHTDPLVTVTGSVKHDIALIDEVIGIGEIAISDHRSSQPTFEELARISSQARLGGILGHKPGLVHFHMGGGPAGMNLIFRLVNETEIPIGQFLPTHVTRTPELFEQALEFCLMGGNIDITMSQEEDRSPLAADLRRVAEKGISWDKVTFTSDSGGSLPKFDDQGNFLFMGVGTSHSLLAGVNDLCDNHGFEFGDLLACLTTSPAARLGLTGVKGCLEVGADADLVLLDSDRVIKMVYAGGKQVYALS